MAIFTVEPHSPEEQDYNAEEHGSFIENVNLIAHRIRVTETSLYQDIEEIVNTAYLWAALPFPGEPDPINHPGLYSSMAYASKSEISAQTSKYYSDQLTTLVASAHGLPVNDPATANYDSVSGIMEFGIPTGIGATGPIGPEGPVGPGIDVQGTLPYEDIIAITGATIGDIYIVSTDHVPEALAGDGMIWDHPVGGGTDHWDNFGQLRGPQGVQGIEGHQGATGPQGAEGPRGEIGPQGVGGLNATTIITATVTSSPGSPASVVDLTAGQPELATLEFTIPRGSIGPQGLSAYQIAYSLDPSIGSEVEWVASLAGDDGANGEGWTGGTYNAATGIVTFASDDGLDFATGDLRGADSTVPGPAGDSMMHKGSTPPLSTLGEVGDKYIQTNEMFGGFSVTEYVKTSAGWEVIPCCETSRATSWSLFDDGSVGSGGAGTGVASEFNACVDITIEENAPLYGANTSGTLGGIYCSGTIQCIPLTEIYSRDDGSGTYTTYAN